MKNVKRALSLVLVLALALSMCVLGAGAVKYSDVENSYAYSAEVQFLSDLEIITGYPDGTFQPEGTITRAESAAVIFRMLAGKQSAAENYQGGTVFSDVSAEHWASGYVNFCTEMGIINGYPDGTFLPDQQVTYGEYVTMLARALGLDIGKDLSYPFGYIAEATVENVNYGVDLSASEPCPRGAVAKLTYNAILDATYRRIANNIYVTEKPTIAKDVLKLQLMEGVVTSIDYYDWAGDNAVGEGKFRITWAKNTENIGNLDGSANSEWAADYELDNSYLGKEVKVWYKPDSVTASGDKVYAVIEKASTTSTLPHIVLKGATEGKENELTYALNDVDYKAKLDDDCIFVENNEYLGDLAGNFNVDNDVLDATEFYPAAIRCWLPINYTFIDNDSDGKYEFVVREIYGFAEVNNLTSSKINVEGQPTIDRNDDAGNAYAWNDGLADVEEGDWVIYYADGSVSPDGGYTDDQAGLYAAIGTMVPDLSSDNALFDDTHYATFEKMDYQTLTIDEIEAHDIYVFDGTAYRTWSAGGDYYTDLVEGDDIYGEIGDEFDLYLTSKFGGIIASAEAVDASTGKFMTITDIDENANLAGNFEIYAVTEDGNEDVYTVKADKKDGLRIFFDSEEITEQALTSGNLYELIGDNGYALCEYRLNSKGQVTALDMYACSDEYIDSSDDDYYSKTSGILKTTIDPDDGDPFTTSYTIAENAVVFVVEVGIENDEFVVTDTKTYIGAFPKLADVYEDTAPIVGMKYKEVSGTNEVKAMSIVVNDDARTSGISDDEDIAGYLRNVKRTGNSTDGYYYEYTIAYGTETSAVLRSRVGADIDELEDIVADDELIDTSYWTNDMNKKAGVILFNIQLDGTIAEMRYQAAANNNGAIGATEGNDYFSSFMLLDKNTSKGLLTLIPVSDNATGSAKSTDDAALLGEAHAKQDNSVIYKCAEDVSVFVFDMKSTNEAKVELEGIGSITKLVESGGTFTEGTLISFAYDADDELITAIFVNGSLIEAE